MLLKQRLLLSVYVRILRILEKVERIWLILEIVYDRQIMRLAKPVQEILFLY